jgi:hypothetical protein
MVTGFGVGAALSLLAGLGAAAPATASGAVVAAELQALTVMMVVATSASALSPRYGLVKFLGDDATE